MAGWQTRSFSGVVRENECGFWRTAKPQRGDTKTNRPCSKPAGHGGDCHFLCEKREKTTNRLCSKPAKHDGYCCFTPKDFVSLSSIKRIVGAVTKGHLKSKAGLDDEDDVMKGSNSVERLQEIFDKLSTEI